MIIDIVSYNERDLPSLQKAFLAAKERWEVLLQLGWPETSHSPRIWGANNEAQSDTPKTATKSLKFQDAPPGTHHTLIGHGFYRNVPPLLCIKRAGATCHIRCLFLVLCHVEMCREFNIVSQITPPPKSDTKKAQPRFCSYGVEFGDLYLNGRNYSRPPIHDCSGPDRQDGVHERNWSITDEAANGPSSDSQVCRSGATQDQMRILVGDRTIRTAGPT
jgi:hypothetical protein